MKEHLKSQEYLDFLQKLIQIIIENEDKEIKATIYSFLENHLDKLDESFGAFLYKWAQDAFSNLELNQAKILAAVILKLGYLIQKCPLGNFKSNLEIAIKAYQSTLKIYNSEIFPQEWAMTHNNLANAYGRRIKGVKADNLEQVIFHYDKVLHIYTEKDFPSQWAMTQNNLANAYLKRIRGDKAENLERAISHYDNALLISSKTDNNSSFEWARTQSTLGNILRERYKLIGNFKDIQQSITAHKNAIEFIQKIGDRELLRDYLYRLGKALSEVKYYTEAIAKLEECLQFCQEQKNIPCLALTLFELAHLYHQTGKLEQARLYFKDSLRLFRRLEDEENIAAATIALGNLEIQIGKIPQASKRLQEAKEYYQAKDNPERLEEINYLLGILQKA